jgi:riboflavin kinase / FMN adenylyltransferase
VRIHRGLDELRAAGRRERAVTLGVFDGVHRGHTRILEAARAAGRELAGALVLTFWPHPLSLIHPDRAPRLILSLEERLSALADAGLDEVLVLDFDAKLAATPFELFTREILVGELGMRALAAGYDFHLGKGRAGSAEAMAALGEQLDFRVEVVTPCYRNGKIISSTWIREDLTAGRMEALAEALGRPYSISGRVEAGAGAGRGLGFPTANLCPPAPEKLLPPPGVYLVSVMLDRGRIIYGLMNLGWAPTLRGSFKPEVHLLDWEGDLYGMALQVDVLQRIRPEETFPDTGALQAAVAGDREEARRRIAALVIEADDPAGEEI